MSEFYNYKELYEQFMENITEVSVDTIHKDDREIMYEEIIQACYDYDSEASPFVESEYQALVVPSETIPVNYMVNEHDVNILQGVIDDDGMLDVYSITVSRDKLHTILGEDE